MASSGATARDEGGAPPARARRVLHLARKPAWHRCGVDWAVLVVLVIVLIVAGTRKGGFRRQFYIGDASLQHPYVDRARPPLTRRFAEHERVPSYAVVLMSLIAPLVAVVVLSSFRANRWVKMHNSVLGELLHTAAY